MSVLMLLKVFSDCCICFAILACGPVSFSVPLLIPALICGVAAGIATFLEGKGWTAVRRLCCVLPLTCLLLAQGRGQTLLLAIPAVYTAATILRGRLELEYAEYRHFFIRSLQLLGVACVVGYIWNFLTQISSEEILQLDIMATVRYGLVHLLCGVVLQRQLRLGVGYRAEGGRRQMTALLGTLATITAGFALAEPLLRQGMGTVIRAALSLVLTPFAFLLDMAGRLFAMLTRSESDKKEYEEFVKYMESVLMDVENLTGKPQEQPPTENRIDPTVIWAVLAGILLLIAAGLLLRSFRKRGADGDPGEKTVRLITTPKKKREPMLSNRGSVRQAYRDFLRAEKNLGMKLRQCDTSADIHQRIHPQTHEPSAEALRQVYLLARYDDRQTISRRQVNQARKALKLTRQEKTK